MYVSVHRAVNLLSSGVHQREGPIIIISTIMANSIPKKGLPSGTFLSLVNLPHGHTYKSGADSAETRRLSLTFRPFLRLSDHVHAREGLAPDYSKAAGADTRLVESSIVYNYTHQKVLLHSHNYVHNNSS